MATAPRHATAFAEINITPLVDVMLVLLVIFMLAAPLLLHRLDVTVNGKPPKSEPPPRVDVQLDAEGRVRWDGVALTRDMLAAQLAYEARRSPQPLIEIDGADQTPYAALAELLAAAERAGLKQVRFAEL
jgi:biopolymer transport protein ExbD